MSADHRQQLVDHARAEAPNECCGILWTREGAVAGIAPADNPRASPYGYELDPRSLLRANELDEEGFGVGVYHSHPRTPAVPSQTDINLAAYPHWTYVIVSLEDGAGSVRAWRIADGKVEEEEVGIA